MDLPASFPQFNDLPREIRFMIYDLLLPGPRIITLWPHQMMSGLVDRVWRNQDIGVHDNLRCGIDFGPETLWAADTEGPRIPDIFFACRESYDYLSKFYHQCFSSSSSRGTSWFSSEHDTLYLPPKSILFTRGNDKGFPGNMNINFAHVKRLAFSYNPEHTTSQIFTILSWFENLEHVSVVNQLRMDIDWDYSNLCIAGRDLTWKRKMHAQPYDIAREKSYERVYAQREQNTCQWLHSFGLKLSRLHSEAIACGKSTLNTFPMIDQQMITTPRKKIELERCRTRFYAEKNKFRISLHLCSDEYKTIPIAVGCSMTVGDLLEAYRSSVDLSGNLVLSLRPEDSWGHVGLNDLVFDLPQIESHPLIKVGVEPAQRSAK